MKTYTSSGIVYGKTWGGGFGGYEARKLEAKTYKGLLNEAKKELKTGGLDGGMGFEYLKGALLTIKTTDTILIKGKEYINNEYDSEFIGDLTEKEQDFLLENEAYR